MYIQKLRRPTVQSRCSGFQLFVTGCDGYIYIYRFYYLLICLIPQLYNYIFIMLFIHFLIYFSRLGYVPLFQSMSGQNLFICTCIYTCIYYLFIYLYILAVIYVIIYLFMQLSTPAFISFFHYSFIRVFIYIFINSSLK